MVKVFGYVFVLLYVCVNILEFIVMTIMQLRLINFQVVHWWKNVHLTCHARSNDQRSVYLHENISTFEIRKWII